MATSYSQSGSGTLYFDPMTSHRYNTFTFPVVYAEVPEVTINFSDSYLIATLHSVTKTGFTVDAYNYAFGKVQTKDFSWTAVGVAFV